MAPSEYDEAAQTCILIADDDRLVRTGMAAILESASDMRITAQAIDSNEALREIWCHQPELPIAMLTTFSDDNLIADALSANALGFLLKSDEPQQVMSSIRALAHGGGAFSPHVPRWLASREQTNHRTEKRAKTSLPLLRPARSARPCISLRYGQTVRFSAL